RLGAPPAEGHVVFAAAELVGVAFDRQPRSRIRPQPARMALDERAVFRLYFVAVELIVDAALEVGTTVARRACVAGIERSPRSRPAGDPRPRRDGRAPGDR